MASQIQVTNIVNETLAQWAKSKGISVKQLVNEILAAACANFLDGKTSSLKDVIQDLEEG